MFAQDRQETDQWEAWVRETLDRLAALNEVPWQDAAPEDKNSSDKEECQTRQAR
jgi:hypothetical protein